MAKRFCDTDVWKHQRWFRKLDPIYKLAFGYIKDLCNHAGCWKIDCADLVDDLGIESFDIDDFILKINVEYDKISGSKITKERVRMVKGYLWITGFIQFQYEGKCKSVNWAVASVRTALMFLESLGILEDAVSNKGYITLTQPLQEGWQTRKDKDKDKDNSFGKSENLLNKKSNGKENRPLRSFQAQREDLLFDELSRAKQKANKSGTEDR